MSNMPSDKIIQETMDKIFNRPEFTMRESFLDRIQRLITEFMMDLFGNLFSKINFTPNSPFSWLSVLFITLVIFAAFAALIYFAAKAAVFVYEKRYCQKSEYLKESSANILSGSQALELARSCRQKGLYSDAVRYMFIYLLFRLHELGYIKLAENRTNNQYLREMAKKSYPKMDIMKAASFDYEKVVYGGMEINAEQYEKWCHKIEILTEGVERQ